MFVPTIFEASKGSDLFSRLLEDRIILVSGEVTDQMAEIVTAELLYLAQKSPSQDIQMYINSPGGSISAGMAIYDTMNHISCDVVTIAMGTAASMGSFLLSGGTKGKRYSLPNSEILIHQPLIAGGGISGQTTDILINAKHMDNIRKKMNTLLAKHTGQTLEWIETNTERDNWMTPEQAKECGLIDEIIE